MKTIQEAMLEEIYLKANEVSKQNNQVVENPVKNGEGAMYYYVTLAQLEVILKEFES